jgi:hypothetical protein
MAKTKQPAPRAAPKTADPASNQAMSPHPDHQAPTEQARRFMQFLRTSSERLSDWSGNATQLTRQMKVLQRVIGPEQATVAMHDYLQRQLDLAAADAMQRQRPASDGVALGPKPDSIGPSSFDKKKMSTSQSAPLPPQQSMAKPIIQRVLGKGLSVGTDVVRHQRDGDQEGWKIKTKGIDQYRVEKGEGKEKERNWVKFDDLNWSQSGDKQGRLDFLADLEKEKPSNLEKWAIYQYAGNAHAWINPLLGDRATPDHKALMNAWLERPKTKEKNIESVEQFIGLIKSGLRKLPDSELKEGEFLTKGVNLESKIIEVDDPKDPKKKVKKEDKPRYSIEDHEEEKIYTVKEFNSTSSENPFLDRDSLIVYYSKGVHGGKVLPDDFSPSSNEAEVLFPPGMAYRVLKVTDKEDQEEFYKKLETFKKQKRDAIHAPHLNRIVEVEIIPDDEK